MIIKSYAKINLYLAVLSKRSDGYHDILTLMHNVSLYDTIEITESTLEEFDSNVSLKWNESNTLYKAIRVFQSLTGIMPRLKIRLFKGIPTKAGLGGASSDAASLLWYLCKKYSTENKIKEMAKKVGSDVSFFLNGGCAVVSKKGECIEKLKPLNLAVEFYTPKIGFSTSKMYKLIDEKGVLGQIGDPKELHQALEKGNVELAKNNMYNAFEMIAREKFPLVVKEALNALKEHELVMMTGSGSTFFGLDIHEKATKKGAHLTAHPRSIQN